MNNTEPDYALDTLNVRGSILSFPDQCRQVIEEITSLSIPSEFGLVKNIVVSGMGGSALGGRVLSAIIRNDIKIPFLVSTEYNLPGFVDENTLVIISSYSGNTEETLMSLAQARNRNAKIVCLTTGGKLAQTAGELNLPSYVFDPKFNPSNQPRMSLGYSIMSIAGILSQCGFLPADIAFRGIPEFLKSRQQRTTQLTEVSRSLLGKIPVLIASCHLIGAAHCFKNQINENAKNYCDLYDLPELNHHLLEGLAFPKSNPENLVFLFIRSNKYPHEISIRYPLAEEIIKRCKITALNIDANGSDFLTESLDLIQSGAYIAYYLSLFNGIDPGPIPWVDWYKDEIRKVV